MERTKPPKDYVDVVEAEENLICRPIGVARTPFRERFGTPRQGIIPGREEAIGRIELNPKLVPPEALRDLDGFDYLWAIYWLHLNKGWNPMVKPPRGPRVKRGTLATRAPHRPNPIGLSALKVLGVEKHTVHVSGVDLLDGTPILDIKPYVPYCDAFPDASAGWVDGLD